MVKYVLNFGLASAGAEVSPFQTRRKLLKNELLSLVWAVFFCAAAPSVGIAAGLVFTWPVGLVCAVVLGLFACFFARRFLRSLASIL
jgi:hypothetical protein